MTWNATPYLQFLSAQLTYSCTLCIQFQTPKFLCLYSSKYNSKLHNSYTYTVLNSYFLLSDATNCWLMCSTVSSVALFSFDTSFSLNIEQYNILIWSFLFNHIYHHKHEVFLVLVCPVDPVFFYGRPCRKTHPPIFVIPTYFLNLLSRWSSVNTFLLTPPTSRHVER